MKSHIMGFLALIVALLSINLALASPLEMSPSHISLNIYAGENVTKYINFTVEGIQLVRLNYSISGNSSPVDLTIVNMSPTIVNGFDSIPFNFKINIDTMPQSYVIDLVGGVEIEENIEIPLPTHSGGGGIGSGSIKVIHNNSNQQCFYFPNNLSKGVWINCNAVPKISDIYSNNISSMNVSETGSDATNSPDELPNLRKLTYILGALAVATLLWLASFTMFPYSSK